MKLFAILIYVSLAATDVLAQMQCRQEMADYVCRDTYGQVISRCRMEMSEYVCRDQMGTVVQRCRQVMGSMMCR